MPAKKKISLANLRPRLPKSRRGKVVCGAISGLVLLYVLYGIVLYTTGGNDDVTRFVSNFAYYPAAKVLTPGYIWWQLAAAVSALVLIGSLAKLVYYSTGGRQLSNQKWLILSGVALAAVVSQCWLPPVTGVSISYGAFLERVGTFEKIQSSQQQQQAIPQNQDDTIRAQALNMNVAAKLAQQQATKLGVRVSDKQVEEAFKAQAQKVNGEKELKRLLRERLGWSVGQYKQELRANVLLQEELNKEITSDEDLNKEAQEKAEGALKRLQGGEDFAKVAKEVSEDPTANKGGKQGKLKRGEMDPAIEQAAFSVKVGELSDVIKSSQGFTIIRVDARGKDDVTLSQITVLGKSVSSYFQEILPKSHVWVFVDGLSWNKNLFAVQPDQPATPSPLQSGAPAPAQTSQPAPQQ